MSGGCSGCRSGRAERAPTTARSSLRTYSEVPPAPPPATPGLPLPGPGSHRRTQTGNAARHSSRESSSPFDRRADRVWSERSSWEHSRFAENGLRGSEPSLTELDIKENFNSLIECKCYFVMCYWNIYCFVFLWKITSRPASLDSVQFTWSFHCHWSCG